MTHKTPYNICCVMGTRPEVLKMAPVAAALERSPLFCVRNVVTAQHREMADQMLAHFDLQVHEDFNVMAPNQSLSVLTERLLGHFAAYFKAHPCDMVIAQGDTTTTMVAALSAFYAGIPFVHVEAGLRTYNLQSPYPEELNRQIADRIAVLNFAPTERAKQHVLQENIQGEVRVVGNTIIDTLFHTVNHCTHTEPFIDTQNPVVLVTCHRRESVGVPLRDICKGLVQLCDAFPDLEIVLPVHPNPQVEKIIKEILQGVPAIHCVPPLDYESMVRALQQAQFVMTDSGGLQEEAPALGKPVLVLRNETERLEGIEKGVARLIGTDPHTLVAEASVLLTDKSHYQSMVSGGSPYGDGKASERICGYIEKYFLERESVPAIMKKEGANLVVPL